MALIEIENITKRYGDRAALSEVSLRLERGLIGLLGPNGAGKSTLLKSILGLLTPEQGVVRVLGHEVARDPLAARSRVGYMPEGDAVFADQAALEYVTLAGELCGLPRAESIARAHQVLHYVGLGEARYRKLGSYSTGMKQRARLAQALVGDPKLILLDEPTSGLDPRGRDEMLALVHDIPRRTGASVILSTHILPDVEKTCDQVVLLAQGKVRYAGPLEDLLRGEQGIFEVRGRADGSELQRALELSGCVVTNKAGVLFVRVGAEDGAKKIFRVASENNLQVRHVAPLRHSLESAFLKVVDAAGA